VTCFSTDKASAVSSANGEARYRAIVAERAAKVRLAACRKIVTVHAKRFAESVGAEILEQTALMHLD
jgi:hypothetical protein